MSPTSIGGCKKGTLLNRPKYRQLGRLVFYNKIKFNNENSGFEKVSALRLLFLYFFHDSRTQTLQTYAIVPREFSYHQI